MIKSHDRNNMTKQHDNHNMIITTWQNQHDKIPRSMILLELSFSKCELNRNSKLLHKKIFLGVKTFFVWYKSKGAWRLGENYYRSSMWTNDNKHIFMAHLVVQRYVHKVNKRWSTVRCAFNHPTCVCPSMWCWHGWCLQTKHQILASITNTNFIFIITYLLNHWAGVFSSNL